MAHRIIIGVGPYAGSCFRCPPCFALNYKVWVDFCFKGRKGIVVANRYYFCPVVTCG